MRQQHHYRRRTKDPAQLDMTTFLNLMVVLVPFLLITAVFSRITIVELSLPTSTGGAAPSEPSFRDDAYDLGKLSELVMSLKRDYPNTDDASVLLEPDIEYDHLIQVMDVVRSVERPGAEGEAPMRVALFTDIAIGDAP